MGSGGWVRAAAELDWFAPAGTSMTSTDWSDPSALAVAICLEGSDDPGRAAHGSPLLDDDFLVPASAWWQPLGVTVPVLRGPRLAGGSPA